MDTGWEPGNPDLQQESNPCIVMTRETNVHRYVRGWLFKGDVINSMLSK